MITKEKGQAFISWLQKHKEDRGMMSNLRRSLRDESIDRAWPYINSWCDLTRKKEELITRTVAGLFALHPLHSTSIGNFGASLRRMADRRGGIDVNERHLKRALASADLTDICDHLPFLVRILKNEGAEVDYEQLYLDLYWWDEGRDKEGVRRNWCRQFYRTGGDDVSNQN